MAPALPEIRIKSLAKYLPVLTIVLVAGTFLVLVIVFTIRNINAQNERMEEFIARQGISVITTLEAGTLTGFMEGDWGIENVQMLIEKVAQNPDVDWVGLARNDGFILAHSEPEKIGRRLIPDKDLETVKAVIRIGEPVSFRRELSGGRETFEIWKPFTPFLDQVAQAELISRHSSIGQELLSVFDRDPKYVAFVALKMDRFMQIRRQEIFYAIFMGLILFVIGSAAVYFIFVVQNAYLVRRTLDEMRTYTKNVLESMANGLITVDRALRVQTFNPSALDNLGKTREEVDGRPISELLPLDDEVREVLGDPNAVLEKEITLFRDGNGRSVLGISVSALKQPDSEVARGAVLIVRDLSMIRDLEQKVAVNEKFAALGRLSAGVAHEIRNPLNSIRGFIQYFQKKLRLDEEDYNYTELMLTEVDRLNRVISKLLAYSKPREPRLVIRSADEILDHCIRVLEREAAQAGVEIVREPADDDPPLILMDTDQMTQVILNVLINAIEATPRRGRILVGRYADEEDGVKIVVRDSGEGIPPEHLDKLFDPFFSTKKKGTGLGLAIVKSIIEGHGGEISVESEVGKGASFIIRLRSYQTSDRPSEGGEESPAVNTAGGA